MRNDAPLYVNPCFLEADACGRIRRAMDRGAPEAGEVLDGRTRLDRLVRRVSSIDVDARTIVDVEARLDTERDAIAAFHRCRLAGREGVSFLRYGRGDFYTRHRDRGVADGWPGAARRRISVVVFLNDAGATGGFTGGELRLLDGAPAPVAIVPRQGCLVAFPAMLLHEVVPVRSGTRDTLVDWFYDMA